MLDVSIRKESESWITYVGPEQAELRHLLFQLIGEDSALLSSFSIGRLFSMSIEELKQIGVSETSAKRLACSFELVQRYNDYQSFVSNQKPIKTPNEAYELGKWIANKDREHFMVVYLNAANIPIFRKVISIGTLNRNLIHPREIFKYAFMESAASMILYHNHPSFSLEESKHDVEMTKRMIDAGETVGIRIFDHLIVSPKGYNSLKEKGYFNK